MKLLPWTTSVAITLLFCTALRADARVSGHALAEALIGFQETMDGAPTETLFQDGKTRRTNGEGKKMRKNVDVQKLILRDPARMDGFAHVRADRAERTVKVMTVAHAQGSRQTHAYPENTRIVHSSATARYRDILQISSASFTNGFTGARVEFTFHYDLTALASKTEAAGGGGSSAQVQAMVEEEVESMRAVGSAIGHGISESSVGLFTMTVTGDIGPEGFRNGAGIQFTMTASAFGSASRYFAHRFRGGAELKLDSIRVFDSAGEFIPPRRLKFDSTSGRDYRPVFNVDPFDASSVPLRGSISPAGGSPIDDLSKGFFGAIDALLRPLTNQGGSNHSGKRAAEAAFLFTSKLSVGNDQFTVKGSFDAEGVASFAPGNATTRRLTRKDGSQVDLSLMLERFADPPRITGILTDVSGTAKAEIRMDLLQFTKSNQAPAYYHFVPEEMLGLHTVALPAVAAPNRGLSADAYPEGAGVGKLVVGPGGSVRLTARLADGTPFSASGWITSGGRLFFYKPLYKGKGVVGGALQFEDADASDVAADDLVWIRPASAKSSSYADGWADGISLELLGAKYTVPPRSEARSVFPDLGAEGPEGNLVLEFSGAGLPDADAIDTDPTTPFRRALNVSAKNKVSVAGANDLTLTPRIVVPSGLLQGSARFPGDQQATGFQSVILQKPNTASGYFLRGARSGAVRAALQTTTP